MNDKKLMKELDEASQEWIKNKNIIDTMLLEQIFRMEGGDILTNNARNRAVGYLPFPGNLKIYFFEVTKDDRLKYLDERGIIIDEGSKAIISHAIRLCELRRDVDDANVATGTDDIYQ